MSELKEAYLKMQEASGIKIGDTVKVLRKAKRNEMGWGTTWNSGAMDKFIGKELVVTGFGSRVENGFMLDDEFVYPFFVLEKVKDREVREVKISSDYTAKINDNGGIKVGCQNLDFDKVEEIYEACKKIKYTD